MLFRPGDKGSRIPVENVEIRENDRKRRNPGISPKKRENIKSQETKKPKSAGKGGPSPAPPGDPRYYLNVRYSAGTLLKKRYVLQRTG